MTRDATWDHDALVTLGARFAGNRVGPGSVGSIWTWIHPVFVVEWDARGEGTAWLRRASDEVAISPFQSPARAISRLMPALAASADPWWIQYAQRVGGASVVPEEHAVMFLRWIAQEAQRHRTSADVRIRFGGITDPAQRILRINQDFIRAMSRHAAADRLDD